MKAEQPDLFWAYIKAASPLTDSETLALLSFSEWTPIRRRVAGNNHTPLNILDVLSVDPYPEVRAAVACNTGSPRSTVERLIRDPRDEVRLAIASCSEAPDYALRFLEKDYDQQISNAAKRTLRLFHPSVEPHVLEPPTFSSPLPFGPSQLPPGFPMRNG
ncbi:MAG: hypothetical protein K2W95_22315 [Candidatus Obscuribacterales bacterium]|nr:hypothetical protein [Candidatus Obscuribacterales bacterium]